MNEQQKLEAAIRAIDSQRAVLGDALADASVGPLKARLAALRSEDGALGMPILKQLTILFLDVVGSTTISRFLDSEDTKAVLEGALARFQTVVATYKGHVLSYAGDSVLAVFGAHGALEDDAERAVLAGLALAQASVAYGESVREQYGVRNFAARIGIHTGNVLLETDPDGQMTIHGVAVNIASRMEQSAPSGRVRISDDLYRHVRGIFDVEPQIPLAVKGIDQPMTTYLVARAKPRAFRVATRGIEGIETRMVGRDAELRTLKQAFERLHQESRFLFFLVTAEAGIGKSRLLYEFENWAESRREGFYLFRGRADPQTPGKPYGLLRDILLWRLEIGEMDSMEDAKDRFERQLAPLLTGDEAPDEIRARVHSLGQLIGFEYADRLEQTAHAAESEQIRYRGFLAAAGLFRKMARAGMPIVMLLEDLHWADAASLQFLTHLSEVNHDVPIMVLALARPELFEREPAWPCPVRSHRIVLDALDKTISRTLVDELLKKLDVIPPTLREVIISGAEGNPFYMEELIKVFIDEGAISTGGTAWRVEPERLLEMKVPATLAGVLQARFDGLPPREKKTLQFASIVGTVFWHDALASIDDSCVEMLPSLMRRNLIQVHGSAVVPGLQEYVFNHHLLQNTVHDTIPKNQRRGIHAKVARWLLDRVDAGGTNSVGIAAEHFEKAGDLVSASEHYAAAAEHAHRIYAHDAALGYAAKALKSSDDFDALAALRIRWRLLDVRERTLDVLGRRHEQRAEIDRLSAVATEIGDDALRGEAAWRRSDYSFWVSDFKAMEAHARTSIALAIQAGRTDLKLRAEERLALALMKSGFVQEGRALAAQGIEQSQRLGFRILEFNFRTTLSIIDASARNLERRLFEARKAIAFNRSNGDVRAQARSHLNVSIQMIGFGDYVGAEADARRAVELMGTIGDLPAKPFALNNLSVVACRTGRFEAALGYARNALEIGIQVDQPFIQVWARCCAGDALLGMDDWTGAADMFGAACAMATAVDDIQRLDAAAGLAKVALAQGDLATALRQIEPILAHWASGGTLDGTETPYGIQLACFRTLALADDPRAEVVLANAHRLLQDWAESISDETIRHGLLHDVHEHREIISAWQHLAQADATGAGPAGRPDQAS